MSKISHQDLRRSFRELLASQHCFHTASVFDPMSARIAETWASKSASWEARWRHYRSWLHRTSR